MTRIPLLSLTLCLTTLSSAATGLSEWKDITNASGLGQNAISRVKFADLNHDGRPDLIMLPEGREPAAPIVYIQKEAKGSDLPQFELKTDTGLPDLQTGDILVFADIDNDGNTDALIGRYLDLYQENYARPPSDPTATGWLKGNGDATFSSPVIIKAATMGTTRAMAVGDVNRDGLPDLWIGNWYERYFTGFEGFANDLLLQYRDADGQPDFVRWPIPMETAVTTYKDDLGGRPTYGVALPTLDDGLPMLLELNYGRRWNRLYQLEARQPISPPRKDMEFPENVLQDERARGAHLVRQLRARDIAPGAGVDGDAIRHGRHPVWPLTTDDNPPRAHRSDEAPFRSNGNTFDVAVGDIDNDGDFDMFLSTIIHAWAGESSDRSRFLVNQLQETGKLAFLTFDHLSVDRIPELPPAGTVLSKLHTHYNQGDIQAELADLNHDGRLDLILCSSDYPDPPPHDERLRVYFQQADGRFLDVTHDLGIDHVGAGMPSLADVDGDLDLDIVVGQSFNRLSREQRRAAAITSGALPGDAPEDAPPLKRARLFLNESAKPGTSIMLELVGDPESGTTRDAYGTVVKLTADLDGDPETPDVTQMRQVLGPAGHAGKQHTLAVHFGLGKAKVASRIEIIWPGKEDSPQVLGNRKAGKYTIYQSADSRLSDTAVPDVDINNIPDGHPRLFLNEEAFAALKNRRWDKQGETYWEFIQQSGIEMLDTEPVSYTFIGRRLLGQSRTALKRITTWALLYKTEGDTRFRDRAIEEMEAVAALPDWNPPHYLDVGEMALALAIGTDWLWDDLKREQQNRFIEALRTKGILPSMDEDHPDNWWIYYYNNWNPVCHAGLVASALMIADSDPELAKQVIERAIRALPEAMAAYAPVGAYPEGPAYWDYGTEFTVILLELLDNAFGTRFGLDEGPGFRDSGTYRAAVVTPTGMFYNYADCGNSPRFALAAAWFASRYGDAAAWYEFQRGLDQFLAENDWAPENEKGRVLPFVAMWYPDFQDINNLGSPDLPELWLGKGPNPVAFYRESWGDPEALFLGFKGNDGSVSHAHLDAGSFIFEDEGVRWAIDLGYQTYTGLEQAGLGIWDRRQHSDRWRIFRLGSDAHNVLLIDQRMQGAETKADIVDFERKGDRVHGTVDLTPVYADAAKSYTREFIVHNDTVLQVLDHVKDARERTERQGRRTATLRWRMFTRAEVTVEDNTAILKQDGKTLYLKVHAPERFTLRAAPIDPPPNYWDEENPGVTAIDVWTKADFDGNQTVDVRMSTDPDALDLL